MQRDVAAVIDVGAGERRRLGHRRKNFLGDCAGDRRHRRYETLGMERRDRRRHPARDDAQRPRRRRRGGRTQQRQFGAEFVEHRREASPGRCVCGSDGPVLAESFDHEVDRAIVEMPATVGEASMNRRLSHVTRSISSPRLFAGRGGVRGQGDWPDRRRELAPPLTRPLPVRTGRGEAHAPRRRERRRCEAAPHSARRPPATA
jgi:hypothetical protein